MGLKLKKLKKSGFAEVWEGQDPLIQFHAFIALHHCQLGPALGGVRFWSYHTREQALQDALTLAETMTYKAALADLNLGGGKAVILYPKRDFDRVAIMKRFGEMIQTLAGRYITAKDVGTQTQDMKLINQTTQWVTGLPPEQGGTGDPSPMTALGVWVGIQACVEELLGQDSLENIPIAIQGLGGVGNHLAHHLIKSKAELWVTDISPSQMAKISQEIPVHLTLPEQILTTNAMVFAPCALGQVIHQENIPTLNFKIIAGAANDPLCDETRDAQALHDQKILYAPDFIINAGGLIQVASEYFNEPLELAIQKTKKIKENLSLVFKMSKKQKLNPVQAALEVARQKLNFTLK